MAELLNEAELRRPDFRPGTPVVLADGQAWHLRRPLIWFVPDDGNPSGFRMCLEVEQNDDYQGLMDSLREGSDAIETEGREGQFKFIRAELAIGKRLLLANYDLSPEQVAVLMRFGYDKEGNPEGYRIRDEVMAVAEGLGPKQSPDGTESSLMPSGE